MTLLPNQASDRQHQVAAVGRRNLAPRSGKSIDIDPRRADHDPSILSPLEQQSLARPLRSRQEQIGVRERLSPISSGAHVAISISEGQRLPDREHELEAELALVAG